MNDHIDENACRRLWCAVLVECLKGCLRPWMARQYAARMPEAWIGSRGFREVCDLAGFDPALVERWARMEIARGTNGEVLERMRIGGTP